MENKLSLPHPHSHLATIPIRAPPPLIPTFPCRLSNPNPHPYQKKKTRKKRRSTYTHSVNSCLPSCSSPPLSSLRKESPRSLEFWKISVTYCLYLPSLLLLIFEKSSNKNSSLLKIMRKSSI